MLEPTTTDYASSSIFDSRSGSRCMSDEETPLLQPRASTPSSSEGEESNGTSTLFEAAALVDGAGLLPAQPDQLAKITTYPAGKPVENDSDCSEHDDHPPVVRKESPYLCEISRKRFWLLYAGVLLQYFVNIAFAFRLLFQLRD
ncbi:MAG: hypothetical protein Q9224_004100 [Gallowayella concinna]